MVDRTRMGVQLVLHEGIRLKPYRDTVNKLTIGVGYNVQDRGLADMERILGRRVILAQGITESEALKVLDADIRSYENAVIKAFPQYVHLDEVRQRVVLDMAFNMGYRALSFKNTIRCVILAEYDKAADNMMLSKWADDVGDGPGKQFDRAERLSLMMRTGEDYLK